MNLLILQCSEGGGMRYRIALLILIVMMGVSACNLSSSGGGQAAPTATGGASGVPVVTILSPPNNSEVLVNQQLLVSANANDSVGVTRVQLFANGQIAKLFLPRRLAATKPERYS